MHHHTTPAIPLAVVNRQSCLEPINGLGLRGVLSDDEAAELARRNLARAEQAKAALGTRWAAHPESTHPGILSTRKDA